MGNINNQLIAMHPERVPVAEAIAAWAKWRLDHGYRSYQDILTPPSANMKLGKDMVTYGLSLAQARTSIKFNTCPFSTKRCRAHCVAKNGHGRFTANQTARSSKLGFIMAHPSHALTLIAYEIERAHAKYGATLRIRLNTFSDIRWESVAPWLFEDMPHVSFYDYTKDWDRCTPKNYRLCLSASERVSDSDIAARVREGKTVAVVFDTKRTADLPAGWNGLAVVDGDKSDNRYDDCPGVVVGLRAKGGMRGDTSGFVRKAG